jgi:hypothetical protein
LLDTLKLSVRDQVFVTDQTPGLHLERLRPSTGAPALMIDLEISDAILFQKIMAAAGQRSLKVQARGKEFACELATRSSSLNPAFKGHLVLRQCSPMREAK